MNGTFRFTPRLESLDGRLLPGALGGGVSLSGGYACGVTAPVVAHPAAGVAAREGDGQPHHVSTYGGAYGGVLGDKAPSASVNRSAGEEIPQTT